MTPLEIPLQAVAQQLIVSLRGIEYRLTVYWSVPLDCWVADFADPNGNDILTGIPLVTGADLFEQFDYLDLGLGALIVQTDHDQDAVPTFTNLGTTGHVYYITA